MDENIMMNVMRHASDPETSTAILRAGGKHLFEAARTLELIHTIDYKDQQYFEVMFMVMDKYNESPIIEKIKDMFDGPKFYKKIDAEFSNAYIDMHRALEMRQNQRQGFVVGLPSSYASVLKGEGGRFVIITNSKWRLFQSLGSLMMMANNGEIVVDDHVRMAVSCASYDGLQRKSAKIVNAAVSRDIELPVTMIYAQECIEVPGEGAQILCYMPSVNLHSLVKRIQETRVANMRKCGV